MSDSRCETKPVCACRGRRVKLTQAMLLLCWLSFIVFVIHAESLRRFGTESLRLIRKLF